MRSCSGACARVFWACLVIMISSAAGEAQTRVPQFRDYPSNSPLVWLPKAPDLSSPETWKYRTRITRASGETANFSGHNVLVTWGCGTQCVTGVILNLPSGKVTFLPTVCCWVDTDPGFNAVEFRRNSRLVILSGMLNEQGENATHFFDFKDEKLNPLVSIPRAPTTQSQSPAPVSTWADVPAKAPNGMAVVPTTQPAIQYDVVAGKDDNDRDPTFMKAFGRLAEIRETAAASSTGWPAEYASLLSGIQEAGGFATYRYTQLAMSFLVRGGVFVPIQSTRRGSVFVIFNPVIDVGLVFSFSSGVPDIPRKIVVVPGEILRGERINEASPRWTKSDGNLVDTVRKTSDALRKWNATSYGKSTSTLDPVSDYTKTLAANPEFKYLARDRLLASGRIADNEGISCGENLDTAAETVENMRRAVAPEPLPIEVDRGIDTSTYAVGGAVGGSRGVKLYALRKNPYLLFAVWFRTSGSSCVMESIVPMSVFAQTTAKTAGAR